MLWQKLKRKQTLGYDFDRQRPIDDYIVDFYCKKLKLAIEIDGDSHYGNEKYDEGRQKKLESLGVRFLRFDDTVVRYDLDGVVNSIINWIIDNK